MRGLAFGAVGFVLGALAAGPVWSPASFVAGCVVAVLTSAAGTVLLEPLAHRVGVLVRLAALMAGAEHRDRVEADAQEVLADLIERNAPASEVVWNAIGFVWVGTRARSLGSRVQGAAAASASACRRHPNGIEAMVHGALTSVGVWAIAGGLLVFRPGDLSLVESFWVLPFVFAWSSFAESVCLDQGRDLLQNGRNFVGIGPIGVGSALTALTLGDSLPGHDGLAAVAIGLHVAVVLIARMGIREVQCRIITRMKIDRTERARRLVSP